MPEYFLEIETEVSFVCVSLPHTRQGFDEALGKIDNLRKSCKIISAQIISSRDGTVFNI